MISDINLKTLKEWLPCLRTQYQIRGDAIVPRHSHDAPTVEQMSRIRACHYSVIPMVEHLIAFYEAAKSVDKPMPSEPRTENGTRAQEIGVTRMETDQPVACPLVIDKLISASIKTKEWLESNFSDTDFDLDGCMAEAHAEFSNALYDARKHYREPAPLMRESIADMTTRLGVAKTPAALAKEEEMRQRKLEACDCWMLGSDNMAHCERCSPTEIEDRKSDG